MRSLWSTIGSGPSPHSDDVTRYISPTPPVDSQRWEGWGNAQPNVITLCPILLVREPLPGKEGGEGEREKHEIVAALSQQMQPFAEKLHKDNI